MNVEGVRIAGVHRSRLRRHPDALLPLCVRPRGHHLVRPGHLPPLRATAGDSGQFLLQQVRIFSQNLDQSSILGEKLKNSVL